MILTGLFAPGEQCSAAAALGMAYFFVLKSQTAFDVRWCKGNIGDLIFAPWCEKLRERGEALSHERELAPTEEERRFLPGSPASPRSAEPAAPAGPPPLLLNGPPFQL